MEHSRLNIFIPALICTAALGILTVLFVLNANIWPLAIPLSLLFGVMGLIASPKSSSSNEALERDRGLVTIIAILSSMLIYAVTAVIASGKEESGRTGVALFFIFFFILPFYFGVASLLSRLLVRDSA